MLASRSAATIATLTRDAVETKSDHLESGDDRSAIKRLSSPHSHTRIGGSGCYRTPWVAHAAASMAFVAAGISVSYAIGMPTPARRNRGDGIVADPIVSTDDSSAQFSALNAAFRSAEDVYQEKACHPLPALSAIHVCSPKEEGL